MRMQFYGKSSSNLVAGVLLIFSLIVLYNYWNVSTYNKDLATKLRTLEQQSISISRANAALQSNLEQTHEEKTNLQLSLRREEGVEKDVKTQLNEKEKLIKKLQNEVAHIRDEKDTLQTKISAKDSEISELKEKITNLEAQLVEKRNANDELARNLAETKKALEDAEKLKLGGSSSTVANAKTINKNDDLEPVLLSDPAVPYPDGWMDPSYPRKVPHVQVKAIDLKGVVRRPGPVIVLDPPNAKPVKARFSVLDPPKPGSSFFRPEQQMGPDNGGVSPIKSPDKQAENNGVVPAPNTGNEDENNNGGGEQGVLPMPNRGAGNNLDAAEDDVDHPLKEGGQDDQSPDGMLSAKELAVGPAPPAQNNKNEQHDGGAGVPNHHNSGQDIREAAHLADVDVVHNAL